MKGFYALKWAFMRVGLTIPKKLLKWRPPFALEGRRWSVGSGLSNWDHLAFVRNWKAFKQAWRKRVCGEAAGLSTKPNEQLELNFSESRKSPGLGLFSPSASLLRPGSQANSPVRNGNGLHSSCGVLRYKEPMRSPHPVSPSTLRHTPAPHLISNGTPLQPLDLYTIRRRNWEKMEGGYPSGANASSSTLILYSTTKTAIFLVLNHIYLQECHWLMLINGKILS